MIHLVASENVNNHEQPLMEKMTLTVSWLNFHFFNYSFTSLELWPPNTCPDFTILVIFHFPVHVFINMK